MPKNTPCAYGSLCGVRSPLRYGRKSGAIASDSGGERADFGEQRGLVGGGELADPAQAARRRQHHAHLMPAIRNRVTERVHRRRRIRPEAVAHDAQHARRAERQEAVAGFRRADADRARRVVAAARRDDHAFAQAEFARELGAQRARRLAAFGKRAASARASCRRRRAVRPTSRGVRHRARACRRHPTDRRPSSPVRCSRR